MPAALLPRKRQELYNSVNADLDPQAARGWYERPEARADPAEGFPRQLSRKPGKKSKGRGGRKVGRAGEDLKLERERLARRSLVVHYALALVAKDTSLDPWRITPLARHEEKLWDELRDQHVSLRDAKARMVVVEQEAVIAALNNDPRIARRLHMHRRQLAILYQELELLTMSVAQSRAIGTDAAFIARGRRLKQTEFSVLFGWWSADQLLRKHGMEPVSEDSDVSHSSGVILSSESEGDDPSMLLGVSEADIHALFASDVEDDSDMDDLVDL